MVRVVFEVKTHDFEDEENSVENFMRKRSTTNFNYSTLFHRGQNYTNMTWKGMSIHSPLHICTMENEKGEGRPKIASINLPPEVKQRIIFDYNLFNDICVLFLTKVSL